MLNWRGRPISLSGYERVESPLYCVLTRIRVRHFWAMPIMWRAYRRVRTQARQVAGLKRSAFLVQDLHTFFILSIWEGEKGFLEFGTDVIAHVHAANGAFARVVFRGSKPEVWSTQWQIHSTSHNLSWGRAEDWSSLWVDLPAAEASIQEVEASEPVEHRA